MKNWLAAARRTNDPAGGLIGEMARDANLPSLLPNIDAMRSYLRANRACPEALAAVPVVWRRYSRWLQRHPWG